MNCNYPLLLSTQSLEQTAQHLLSCFSDLHMMNCWPQPAGSVSLTLNVTSTTSRLTHSIELSPLENVLIVFHHVLLHPPDHSLVVQQ